MGLLIIGSCAGVVVINEWIYHQYGVLYQVTTAVFIMCSVILGLESIFTALISSMMVLSDERKNLSNLTNL